MLKRDVEVEVLGKTMSEARSSSSLLMSPDAENSTQVRPGRPFAVEWRAAGQSVDAVDVQARRGDDAADRLEMRGSERRTEHGDQVATLALRPYPLRDTRPRRSR